MKGLLLIPIVFLISCSTKPSIENLTHLNGYWEIQEVQKPNTSSFKYSYNSTIDYFEINDELKGFRKKLMPQLDGTFQENGTAETIAIITDPETLKIIYTTPYSTWEESIIKLNERELELVNTDKVRYIYKRYSPLNFSE
ncbi:hypothetical protein [Aegicerativicinus sediminis]|uniref:hypothetical protein n=1 Tax=Aegicerativicinus sediminis TaxID=2893202 RepID=UPI001E365DFF|nr:hypothetical protein [Aegicerativicinus sediminis]